MSTKPSDQKTLNLKLAASAEDGDVVMASQLLSLGADPMGGHAECLLLRLAAKNGHAECVTLLIPTSQLLSLNSEPLIHAIDNGHADIVSLMLEHDPSLCSLLAFRQMRERAASLGHDKLAALLTSILEQRTLCDGPRGNPSRSASTLRL